MNFSSLFSVLLLRFYEIQSAFTAQKLVLFSFHEFFWFLLFYFAESKGRKWRLAKRNCRRSGRRPKERPGGVRSIQLMSSPFRYNNNIMLFSSFLAGIFKKSRKSVFLLKKPHKFKLLRNQIFETKYSVRSIKRAFNKACV